MSDLIQSAIQAGESLFPRFEKAISRVPAGKATRDWMKRNELRIETADVLPVGAKKAKRVEVFYLPFEHLNPLAKIVLVGMSPGHKQMSVVADTVAEQLSRCGRVDLPDLKRRGAFAGEKMRSNLCRMLDYYEIPGLAGVSSAAALFGSQWHYLHTTSLLRYPVFVDGKDFTGQLNMLETPVLRKYVENYFCREIANLDNPYIVPLGDEAADALQGLVREGLVSGARVIDRLRHPSPEGGSRVGYIIEEVARADLKPNDPVMSCVDKYDAERIRVKRRVAELRAGG